MDSQMFAAVTCYFNPCDYSNRKRCYTRFANELARQSVSLWTIEAALPGQDFFLPPGDHVVHVRLPQHDWLWQKERLLNLLIKRLPDAVDSVAWLDCDILFQNDAWARLTAEALETWPVIQPFDFAYWLGPNDEVLSWQGISDKRASLACIANHYPDRAQNFSIGWPGFAWAARRELLEEHGLYEYDITGGGDSVIASACYGWKDHSYFGLGNEAMAHDAINYVEAVYPSVRGFVGYIPCQISHLWHGAWNDRAYRERRTKLAEYNFDPFRDLEYDPSSNLLRWTKHAGEELRDYLRSYFFSRQEDSRPDGHSNS